MRSLKIILITLSGILFLSVTIGYAAGCLYFTEHFLPGTMINGFDCSYMKLTDVEELMDDFVKSYALAIHTRNGGCERLTAEEVGMHFISDSKWMELLNKQDPFLWFLWVKKEITVDLTFSVDQIQLEAAIDDLHCMKDMQIPIDAYISEYSDGYQVIQENMGTTLEKEKVISLIETAIWSKETEIDLESCYINPSVTVENSNLVEKCAALNVMKDVVITYDFGDRKETITHDTIRDFLTDQTLDREKVLGYVSKLSQQYDSIGITRTFITYDGREKNIQGGDYGWKTDIEAETDALMEILSNGDTQVRQPEYMQTAMDRSSNDIGYTYLEIDQESNKVVFYIDGIPVVETNGLIGSKIPEGCYRLKECLETYQGEEYCICFGEASAIYSLSETEIETAVNHQIDNEVLGDNEVLKQCIAIPMDMAVKIYESVEKEIAVIVYS